MSETTSRMNYTYPSRDEDPWYDSFESLVTALDSSTFAHREDRSLVFAGGGTLSWTVATSTFTWDDTIQIASTISGRRISISANSLTLTDGQILYLDLTRQPLSNISTSFQVANQLPSTNNACAVAVRIGGVVYFRTGISLTDGATSTGIAPVPSAGGGGPGSDTTAIHDNQSGEIAAIALKPTPTTSDLLLIEDAAGGNAKARITIGALPAATPATHAIGGARHSSSTLAQINTLVSDATLDGVGDPRPDNDAIHDNVAGEIVSITSKGTPTVSDILVIEDVADGNNKKSITIGSLPFGTGTDPDAIHDNVAAEISAITAKATPTTADYLIIEDAADTDNKKSITIGDLPAAAPASHASTHEPGGGDAMTVDAAAATGSLRTLGTGAAQACAGNDSRLSDARTPTSHNTSHQSGGGDAIKLDDLAAPDDNTDLDSTISAHGLLPKLGGGTTNYLRADGTWAAPPGGTDANAIHDNVAAEISAITEKTTPADADLVIIEDSADSYNKKKVQLSNIGGGTTATAAEATSYRELVSNALDTQGVSVVENDTGEGVFNAGLHQSIVFRATLTASWASTGTLTVSLYDDGPTTAPGTPRLVTSFVKTANGGYEVFEQALTIVSSGAGSNQVLGDARVYRVTIEVDGTTGDTGYIGSAGFVATGSAEALSADQIQAIVMSLNA